MVLTPQPALRTVLPLIKTLINKYFNREWEGWGICPRLETQLRIVQPCDQLWNEAGHKSGRARAVDQSVGTDHTIDEPGISSRSAT